MCGDGGGGDKQSVGDGGDCGNSGSLDALCGNGDSECKIYEAVYSDNCGADGIWNFYDADGGIACSSVCGHYSCLYTRDGGSGGARDVDGGEIF